MLLPMGRVGITVLALYVLSIPWYRTPGATPTIVFGVPDWVAVAVACYLAIAVITAIAWHRVRFEEEEDPADP